jgi:hypothetical protein
MTILLFLRGLSSAFFARLLAGRARSARAASRQRLTITPSRYVTEALTLKAMCACFACHATMGSKRPQTSPKRKRTTAAQCAPTDPLTDLVERFSKALLAKLRLAEANGRSGWDRDDWEKQCQEGLLRHVDKGDPRDVAAYCAFMWHHGWITALTSTGAHFAEQPQH